MIVAKIETSSLCLNVFTGIPYNFILTRGKFHHYTMCTAVMCLPVLDMFNGCCREEFSFVLPLHL